MRASGVEMETVERDVRELRKTAEELLFAVTAKWSEKLLWSALGPMINRIDAALLRTLLESNHLVLHLAAVKQFILLTNAEFAQTLVSAAEYLYFLLLF